jgi:hypothetical protein
MTAAHQGQEPGGRRQPPNAILASGTTLALLGGLSALSLAGLARGVLGAAVAERARMLCGMGALPVALCLLGAGMWLLAHRRSDLRTVAWPRILSTELALLAVLALLSLAVGGSNPAQAAADGRAGGLVGWTLAGLVASRFGRPVAIVSWLLIALVAGAHAFGLRPADLLPKPPAPGGSPRPSTRPPSAHFTRGASPPTRAGGGTTGRRSSPRQVKQA